MSGLSGAFTLIQAILGFFSDPGHSLGNALGWATGALFPPELQTWFFGTVGAPGKTWDATHIYQRLYEAAQAPALLLSAAAAAGRLVGTSINERAGFAQIVFDALPRFLIVVLLIGLPGTQVSLGYDLIAWAVDASVLVAHDLFNALLQASLLAGIKPGEGWFTHFYATVANQGRSTVAVVVAAIPLLILFLYAAFLMIVRTVMIGFCIATAPLCLATVAADQRNRFFVWWLDLLVGALMTPIIFAVAISVSLTLASGIVSAAVIGPLLAFVVVAGGLWFSGKMVHALTWRHFSHGGAMAGFAAGASTMLAPMHKLAAAGFMAEALGANAAGKNSALGLMKRIGLASQGFNPSSGESPAMLAAAGAARIEHRLGLPAMRPSGDLPDIASALTPSARPAVRGAESLFAQEAFNSFAHTHGRLIGALTRDQPYRSLSPADRAKLAWSRLPATSQSAFADEFLSVWLGGGGSNLDRFASQGAA